MKKMKKNEALQYTSSFIEELLDGISPLEQAKTDNKMRLAAGIADAIANNGWNQKTFAAEMGKQPSEVSKWLSGTHNFTLDTLTEIAEKLEVSLEHLFDKPVAQKIVLKTVHTTGGVLEFNPSYLPMVSGNTLINLSKKLSSTLQTDEPKSYRIYA